jgi:hypothetical protein
MKNYQPLIDEIMNSEEFQKLKKIGGHKVYHLEGDAFHHTMLVMEEAEKKFGKGHFMVLVALLHDIGKIYTSVCNGENDWSYPHHSDGGAARLSNFIPESMPEYYAIQWYIYNHIKPLFWMGKDMNVETKNILSRVPQKGRELCKMTWLRDLALCDIAGSHSVEPQTALTNFLKELKFPLSSAVNQ